MAAIGRSYFSSLFLMVSMHLSFAGLGRVKLKWDLLELSRKAREVDLSLHPSFFDKGNSFYLGSSFLVLNDVGLGGGLM